MPIEKQLDETMRQIFTHCKTIAVVGLSPKPERPSHYVSAYLQAQGYRIIPVNPGPREILGETAYADLAAVQEPYDWVLCFRRSEKIPAIVETALSQSTARALWMQVGITHADAAKACRAAGWWVVENKCAMVEHRRWIDAT